MSDLSRLSREELEVRLKAAEDVCVLLGWTATRGTSERDKALHELWSRWVDLFGVDHTGPDQHPDLNEEALFALATQRDLTRYTTLRRLRGEDL